MGSEPRVEVRICIDVDDLERAIAFYTSAFALTVARRIGDNVVELAGAVAPIDIIERAAGTRACYGDGPTRDYRRHWTPLHLDIVVPDVDEAVARAEAAGARRDRAIQDHPYGRLANMADPFGHGFCFIELQGAGYDEVAG